MSERRLLNCGAAPSTRVRFSYRCPMRWADLTPTEDPRRRLCGACGEVVHRVHDVIEAGVRADQGECIAVPAALADAAQATADAGRERIIVGRPAAPSEILRQVAVSPKEGPS
ncbi:MAG: hypothetical protein KC613_11325 [Myxococcales bacterium]|nr:hypothetical protein [Myxococcales bacterium]